MAEYRVADLAREAQTSVRNVRVYQDRGLLPPPRREGRIGLYNDAHLARLRLIGRLLARGYTFATIKELFAAWNSGHDLADSLGLREALTAPWVPQSSLQLDAEELQRRYGLALDAAGLARSVELGMLQQVDRDTFHVPSPDLLDAGAELAAAGVPMPAVLELAGRLRGDLTQVAQRFMATVEEFVMERDDEGQPVSPMSPQTTEQLLRLRPYVEKAVLTLLQMAMQRETDALVDRLAERTGAELADVAASGVAHPGSVEPLWLAPPEADDEPGTPAPQRRRGSRSSSRSPRSTGRR